VSNREAAAGSQSWRRWRPPSHESTDVRTPVRWTRTDEPLWKERGFLRRFRVGRTGQLTHAAAFAASQIRWFQRNISIHARHRAPASPSPSLSPIRCSPQARSPSVRPTGARQAASGPLCARAAQLPNFRCTKPEGGEGRVGAKRERKEREGQRCRANLRGAGGFEHGQAPPRSLPIPIRLQQRPPAAPPAGPPSDRSPRPPWQAPWWTAPPATCSSARTGLRTWRSATSATATPGTYPHSPPL
jgi:hypothetical protein